MSNRADLITSFLADTPWATWTQTHLAGDASARRYVRLTHEAKSAILMDADPTTGQDTQAFSDIGAWLKNQDLCAPETYLHDPTNGLMLIEDLGQSDFAACLIKNPTDAMALYTAATDILIKLDISTPPNGLTVMTPKVGGGMLRVTTEWYGGTVALIEQITTHLEQLCGPPDRLALRDFHAENLIWRPDQTGTNRVGLLDYQDAFIAPRGYDLVSLLRDVRRNVDDDVAANMTAHFVAKTGADPAAFACLAVQRNLRILGVFARLALQDHKPRYVTMIPHIWSMITKDLGHSSLAALQEAVHDTLPPPEKSKIRGLL